MTTVLNFPPAERFIETGLGHGDTLAETGGPQGYPVRISIELDPVLADAGQRRFAGDPTVTILTGYSPAMLPRVCDPTQRTVFWLDAHYSGEGFSQDMARSVGLARDWGECPLLSELAAIAAVPWMTRPAVFIDDALFFCCVDDAGFALAQAAGGVAGAHREGWPSLAAIAHLLSGYRIMADPTWRYLACRPPDWTGPFAPWGETWT